MSYELMVKETATEISTSEVFMDAVVELSRLEQFVPTVRVRDDASKAIAAETRAQVKTLEKNLDSMRKSAGAPYLTMTKTVNNLFKPFLASCKKMSEHIDGEYLPYETEQQLVFEETQKAAMKAQIEAQNIGETAVVAEMMQPAGVTDTDSGKTFIRDDIKVTIVNLIKLIKTALDGRNQIPIDIIQINEAKLKQLCRGNMYSVKKWAKYGVKVEKTRKVTTQTV